MKKVLPAWFISIFFSSQSFSQLSSWTTGSLQESNIPVLTVLDASHGKYKTLNYGSPTDAYFHTEVITNSGQILSRANT